MLFTDLPLWLQYSVIAFFAALIGSFLNVVIYRFPQQLMQAWRAEAHAILSLEDPDPPAKIHIAWPPRSHCPQCSSQIRAIDNIPILSFLLLRGRCRDCSHPIHWRYPTVEALTVLSAIACFAVFQASGYAIAAFVFCCIMITASCIDLDTTLLPDELTLPLMWLALLASLSANWPTATGDALLGAAGGYMALWTVYQLFKLLTGKEGMGYGDFKLLAAFGAWFGWQALPILLLLSAAVGTAAGLILRYNKRLAQGQGYPFGPYLAMAGIIMLFWGEQILAWYYPDL